MRGILILILTCCAFTQVKAQVKAIRVYGNIFEKDTDTPVEQATVQLLSLPDSSFVSGTASREKGNFSLSAHPGKYLLKISYIGYSILKKELHIVSSKPSVNLGHLFLSPDAVMLDEAMVIAEAPPVTVKGDTIEYSASAYRTSEGAMLEELVKKLPGAEISSNGKITINGKEIKKIMVDGKEFFSEDPNVSMKNLPADMVEKVKSYDKKSDAARITGIDDGQEETVLDLAVKKEMKKGWIGNLIAGYGTKERYEAGAMLNRFMDDTSVSIIGSINNTNNAGFSEFGDAGMRMSGGGAGSGVTSAKSVGMNFTRNKKELQMNGSVQYGFSNNDARRKNYTETFIGNLSPFENSENSSLRKQHDVRGDFRLEWRPDTLSTLIFRPNVGYSKTNTDSKGMSETLNTDKALINDKSSNSFSKSDNYNINGRLQYFRKLNNKGRNLFFGVNFGLNDSESDPVSLSRIHFYTYDEKGNLIGDSLRTDDRKDNRSNNSLNYGISASYTEPIFKNLYLQLKYDFTHRKAKSESLIYEQEYLSLFPLGYVYSDSLSNGVTNYFDSHSVELSVRGVSPKMMYEIGMDMMPQHSKSETYAGPNTDKPIIEQRFLNYAPAVMFRYMFTKQHSLMFRYRGQSNEPDIESLQETIDITDPLNMRYGNPDLKPSFNHSFMLFYNKFVPTAMRSFSLNFFYSNMTNSVVNRVIYNPYTGTRKSYKENVNGNWNTRSYFSFNTPLKNKKFTLSSFTGLSFNHSVSYANTSEEKEKLLSTTYNLTAGERLSGSYRCDAFDISLNASVDYGLTRNGTLERNNRESYDYTFGGSTNINLPWDLFLSTDINFSFKRGYSSDFNKNEIIWNGQLSKNLLKNKATIRIKVYDILQQQTNVNRTISETSVSDTEYNTLGSYVMVHFVYRLNTLGGKTGTKEKSIKPPRREGFERPRGGRMKI